MRARWVGAILVDNAQWVVVALAGHGAGPCQDFGSVRSLRPRRRKRASRLLLRRRSVLGTTPRQVKHRSAGRIMMVISVRLFGARLYKRVFFIETHLSFFLFSLTPTLTGVGCKNGYYRKKGDCPKCPSTEVSLLSVPPERSADLHESPTSHQSLLPCSLSYFRSSPPWQSPASSTGSLASASCLS